tara:strand:- start:398 stop:763 length:366 start_codon:yes stop_codon:yes gene_type:complete
MTSFKQELLVALETEFSIDPTEVARGIAQVIRGETVKMKLDANDNVVNKSVTTTPKDILQGAMIYDALRGGDLGIAPKSLKGVTTQAAEIVHKRIGVDERIIANSRPLEVEDDLTELFEVP